MQVDMQQILHFAITPPLIAIQLLCFALFAHWTSNRLKKATKRVASAAADIRGGRPAQTKEYPRLAYAIELVTAPVPADSEIALAGDRLLPADYHNRLDAAAPGIFTAIGIVGTFAALIVGFWALDPNNAEAAVAPLIRSMSVAFICSLVGVTLSIIWTIRSRVLRHKFDAACNDLAITVERIIKPPVAWRAIPQLLESANQQQQHLRGELATQLEAVRIAVAKSSTDLVDALSPRLEQSFQSIIASPFERLNALISDFDKTVAHLTSSHVTVARELQSSVQSLRDAKTSLTDSIDSARSVVRFFTSSAETLSLHTASLDASVVQFQNAVSGMNDETSGVENAAARYSTINEALTATEQALKTASSSLEIEAERFKGATAEIRGLVERLEHGTDDRMKESIGFLRSELEGAVGNITTGLIAAGQETVKAYEKSTDQVIEAIDGKMTDLTDRLSAELATLAARLPAEVEGLNQSMSEIRRQINQATRSMDDAVKQLARQTPEALQTQLVVYESALSKAVDHFSGTLEMWDNHVKEISEFSTILKKAIKSNAAQVPAA